MHKSFFITTVGETFPDEEDETETLASTAFSIFSLSALDKGGDGVRESVLERFERDDGVFLNKSFYLLYIIYKKYLIITRT